MTNVKSLISIPAKIILLYCCALTGACLKNTDNTANGPKSQVAITNYVVNGTMNVIFDNTSLTAAPLAFGGGVAAGAGGYTPLGAGLHNLQIASPAGTVLNKTISFTNGLNYSFFIYDTLQNSKVKTLLLNDDLTVIDTVGRGRFLQFIPGSDSLTLTLKKDTTYSFADTYIGNKPGENDAIAFSVAMRPGSYQLTLQKKGAIIFQQATFTVTAGKIYSFISKGTVNGTGDYKESISVVQHN